MNKYEFVKKKIENYKLTTNLLFANLEFYLDIKEIQLDFTRDINELTCLEVIWFNQHYEFIYDKSLEHFYLPKQNLAFI